MAGGIIFATLGVNMLNAYPIALAAGTLASLLWIGLTVSPSRSTTPEYNLRGLDAGLWALLNGLVGGRLGFVLLHLNYYKVNPQEITWFWDGGLSWIGSAIGAILGVLVFALIFKHRFWPLADTIAVAVPIMGFASWLGCLVDSCAYGSRADFGLLTPPSTDMFGVGANRWPVQSMGAILSLIIFLILINLRRRNVKDGILTSVSLGLISTTNLFLYFFRGDSIRLVNGYRLDALATIPILLVSLAMFLYFVKIPLIHRGQKED